MRTAAPISSIQKGVLETMERARSVCRILYRIEDDRRYEWRTTKELLPLNIARDTALQIKRNGLEILVCPAEEFEEKGLPETYEAEEYYAEGMDLPAPEAALDEPDSVSNLRAEGWEPARRAPIETAKTDSDNGPQTSRTKK